MGRPPSRRRIEKLWTRRGSLDCMTEVGMPDPLRGGTVMAIFDMGPTRAVHRLAPALHRPRGGMPRGPGLERVFGPGVRPVSSAGDLELLEAEARYFRDRLSLLRAKLYRWGLGSTPQLRALERRLEGAEQRRVREERTREFEPELKLLRSCQRSTPSAARQLAWVPQTAVRVSHSLPNRSRPTQRRQGVLHVYAVLRRSRRFTRRRRLTLPAGHHRTRSRSSAT